MVGLVIPATVTSLGAITFENSSGTIYCAKPAGNEQSPCKGKYANDLKFYTKDEETGIYEVDGIYYADANLLAKGQSCLNKSQCNDIALSAKSGAPFEVNGKLYNSLNDWLSGNYVPKRIYTVEEAERVSKPTGNTLKLRYK